MLHRLVVFGLFLSLSLGGAAAEEPKRIGATGSIAGASSELGKKQIELLRRVNAYFNQLTNLKGTFIQTSADHQRQRGHFYITRPGRFRFEFNRPSRVVVL